MGPKKWKLPSALFRLSRDVELQIEQVLGDYMIVRVIVHGDTVSKQIWRRCK
jgi:hypothetical protein